MDVHTQVRYNTHRLDGCTDPQVGFTHTHRLDIHTHTHRLDIPTHRLDIPTHTGKIYPHIHTG